MLENKIIETRIFPDRINPDIISTDRKDMESIFLDRITPGYFVVYFYR